MATQQTFLFEDNGSIPISPHEFTIKEISVENACRFNGIYHSRLPIIKPSNVYRNHYYICYGFFIRQVCYAIAIWSSPVNQNFDLKSTIELRRYAIKKESPKNTASWGLNKMVNFINKKFPLINRFISYQDCEVHKGTIYKASGWIATNKTKFVKWDKSRKRNVCQSNADKIRWEKLYIVEGKL